MDPTEAAAPCEAIKLRPFLVELLAGFEQSARARHLTLDALVFLEEMNGDSSMLHRLLAGLVGEALRRAPVGTHVTVVVSPGKGHTEFRIADEGAGRRAEAPGLGFDADAANGAQLSVTETDSGTVVCLAFPGDLQSGTHRPFGVDGLTTGDAGKAKPISARHASGTYARAGALVSTPPNDDASDTARESGK